MGSNTAGATLPLSLLQEQRQGAINRSEVASDGTAADMTYNTAGLLTRMSGTGLNRAGLAALQEDEEVVARALLITARALWRAAGWLDHLGKNAAFLRTLRAPRVRRPGSKRGSLYWR